MEARVALVERYGIVTEGLRAALAQDDGLCPHGAWTDIRDAHLAWAEDPPAAAIVDRRALGLDPVGALAGIRDIGVAVLVRAESTHVDHVHLLLAAGVAGVVDATASTAETLRATRAVVAGQSWAPGEVREALTARLVRRLPVPYMTLSPRERQIIGLAAGGASGREIADRLTLALPTVRTHLKRAYEKLGVQGHTDALFMLTGLGVLILDPAERVEPVPL